MSTFLIGFRELLEYGAVVLLLCGVFERHRAVIVAAAGLALLSGIAVSALLFPLPGLLRKAYTGYLFFSYLAVLFLAFWRDESPVRPVIAAVFALLIPAGQLTSVVLEEVRLAGWTAAATGAAGMAAGTAASYAGMRMVPGLRLKKFFGPDGVMVAVAAFCFLSGGLSGFDDAAMITSLQKGMHVFLGSSMTSLRDMLLIPGGDVVATGFDPVFRYLASERMAMAIAAFLLFLPPVTVFVRLLVTPEPETEGVEKRAERRKIVAVYLHELMRKGTPIVISLLVSVVLLHSANLAVRPTYDPEPVPVVPDGDVIRIPLVDARGDISDGKMRKYSFLHERETFRFFVIMRPDGEVAAVLDACEVCPPRGYVQREDHVVCTYCNTPLPAQSVGQPGGCNPIPLRYRVEGDVLIVSKEDVVDAFRKEAGGETGSVLR